MANDNQTALMMSIQRKKDTIVELKGRIEKVSVTEVIRRLSQGSINFWTYQIDILRYEITEDEKLLEVDRANHIYAHYTGQLHGVRKIPRKGDAADWYNEKYGTDGK